MFLRTSTEKHFSKSRKLLVYNSKSPTHASPLFLLKDHQLHLKIQLAIFYFIQQSK